MASRNVGIVVAMLGTLISECAYVPIDPSFPTDRQSYILAHSKAEVFIVDDENEASFEKLDTSLVRRIVLISSSTGEFIRTIMLGGEKNAPAVESEVPTSLASIKRNIDGLAYVLYTSGSTGKPKGVMVRNKGVHNVITHFAKELEILKADKVLGLTTFCFDISMLELFLPLICGATFVLCNSLSQKDPLRILDVVRARNVTVMQATPTTFEMLIGTGWTGDKAIKCLVGGEACRPAVTKLATYCARLVNVYGPTETSIWSSSFRIEHEYTDNIPIGLPISETQFLLLDEKMAPVGPDDEGELWIGGSGLALGYMHAPELTVKRFKKNPNDPEGGMIYQTGDVVKLIDSQYVFQRRIDDQVKLHGYRIELGEIETVLSHHAHVTQAVVLVNKDALYGYVTVKKDIVKTSEDSAALLLELTKLAKKSLTTYMVPKFLLIVNDFPKTANGKLDKMHFPLLPTDTGVVATNFESLSAGADYHRSDAAASLPVTHSMFEHVCKIALSATGRLPKRSSTFAAIGIDSFAGAMFRSVLSKSLHNISIPIDSIFEPSATVESFSVALYARMMKEKPAAIADLKLVCGVSAEDPDEDTDLSSMEEGNAHHNTDNDSTEHVLAVAMIANRRLLEGIRGVLSIIVIIDHFFLGIPSRYGTRIRADTLLFVIITGFTITLQNLVSQKKKVLPNKVAVSASTVVVADGEQQAVADDDFEDTWNSAQWLYTRALGLFPIYWLTMLISVPAVLMFPAPFSATNRAVYFTITAMGLQSWTMWSVLYQHDIYYVSLIWNIFVMYSAWMSIYHSKWMSNLMKIAGYLAIIGFNIGMYVWFHNGGTTPPRGLFYFAAGALCAHVYMQLAQRNEARVHASSDAATGKCPGSRPAPVTNTAVNAVAPATAVVSTTLTALAAEQRAQFDLYMWGFITDALAFLMFFLIFYNGYESVDPGSKYHPQYMQFDMASEFLGIPLVFALLLIALFLKPLNHRSIFAWCCETRLMVLLGECSLPIYILQRVMSGYYFYIVVGLSEDESWNPEVDSLSKHMLITLPAIFVSVVLSICVQKCFQDQFIMWLHIEISGYFQSKKENK